MCGLGDGLAQDLTPPLSSRVLSLSPQWWWEATVDQVEKAAEEAEGAEIDHFAEMFISDGLGGDVNEVRWIGLKKARDLFDKQQAIFIDCRADHAFLSGSIPGARNVPMERVGYAGPCQLLHLITSSSLTVYCAAGHSPIARPCDHVEE